MKYNNTFNNSGFENRLVFKGEKPGRGMESNGHGSNKEVKVQKTEEHGDNALNSAFEQFDALFKPENSIDNLVAKAEKTYDKNKAEKERIAKMSPEAVYAEAMDYVVSRDNKSGRTIAQK